VHFHLAADALTVRARKGATRAFNPRLGLTIFRRQRRWSANPSWRLQGWTHRPKRSFPCRGGFFRHAHHWRHRGYIAEKVAASDHGLLTNLLVGIAGSFVGGTLANLLHIEFYGWLGNLIVASIGAILVLWVWRRLHRPAAP
jgi:uncharacterized membrane protein YeaQ/YmgE (transglycosylase-associated protein family)